MSANLFPFAISFGAGLLGILAVLAAFREARVDDTRDQLFALRDELFLYAVDAGIVESPAHQNLRLTFNGLIRYAHKITLFRLILLALGREILGVRGQPSRFAEWKAAVGQLPIDQQKKLDEIHVCAMFIMAKHMVRTSPTLIIFGTVLKVLRRFTKSTASAAQTLVFNKKAPIDLLEEDAMCAVAG